MRKQRGRPRSTGGGAPGTVAAGRCSARLVGLHPVQLLGHPRLHRCHRVVPAQRQALWARLQAALDGAPDPWFEGEKARVDARQFIPIPTPITAV